MFSQPEFTHKLWMRMKPHIEEMVNGTGAIPEDVFLAIKTQNAFLFVNDDGFLILQEQRQQFTHKKELFVWLASRWDTQYGLIPKYIEWIRCLAKEIGCDKVTFSGRLGFHKLLDEKWKIRTVIYESEVN